MKKRKLQTAELVLYIIFGVIALAGLTLVVLGTIGDIITVAHNPISDANAKFTETMKMSFTIFGSLVVVVSAVATAITLALYGHKAELEADKKARRLQRLQFEEEIKENVVETIVD